MPPADRAFLARRPGLLSRPSWVAAEDGAQVTLLVAWWGCGLAADLVTGGRADGSRCRLSYVDAAAKGVRAACTCSAMAAPPPGRGSRWALPVRSSAPAVGRSSVVGRSCPRAALDPVPPGSSRLGPGAAGRIP